MIPEKKKTDEMDGTQKYTSMEVSGTTYTPVHRFRIHTTNIHPTNEIPKPQTQTNQTPTHKKLPKTPTHCPHDTRHNLQQRTQRTTLNAKNTNYA